MPTLLVVDDDADIAESLRSVLLAGIPGIDVLTASSADEAWTIVEDREVDVALVDYRLGRDDGLELLRTIRLKSPKMRALLMTAYPSTKAFARAVNWGLVEGLYIKPFNSYELVEKVAALVKRRSRSGRIPASHR